MASIVSFAPAAAQLKLGGLIGRRQRWVSVRSVNGYAPIRGVECTVVATVQGKKKERRSMTDCDSRGARRNIVYRGIGVGVQWWSETKTRALICTGVDRDILPVVSAWLAFKGRYGWFRESFVQSCRLSVEHGCDA